MSEMRIDRAEWHALARTLNERYRGSDVEVTILDPEMGERYEIEPEPLLEIATHETEGIERFDLTIGPLDAPLMHAVPWTRDVWVDAADDGVEEIVSIVGENGITTVIRCCRDA